MSCSWLNEWTTLAEFDFPQVFFLKFRGQRRALQKVFTIFILINMNESFCDALKPPCR